MCDDGPPPDVPLPVPAGYRAMPLPSPEALSHAGVAGRTLLHAPVLVRWPAPYGWTLGLLTARCTRGELDAGTPAGGARATFRVEWCDDVARPGVATHHSYHHLSAQRFADGGDAPDWSWALLAPLGAGADGGGEGEGTRGCGWPGCPGHGMRFSPTRLLQHVRQVHAGQVDDARFRWACGLRCGTCAMPFTATGLAQHLRRDPADGVRRCPSALRADAGCALTIDDADEAFVRGLTADDVYISSVLSLVELGGEAARDVGALVAPLMEASRAAPSDAYRRRLVYVVLAALLRPLGAQQNRRQVLADRCALLRSGGHLEELWRGVCPRRVRRRGERDGAAAGAASGVAAGAAAAASVAQPVAFTAVSHRKCT